MTYMFKASLLACTLGLLLPSHASANRLTGQIKLPKGFKTHPSFAAPGYWLLPNDVLEIRPPHVDPREEMVVVLDGAKGPATPAESPTVKMQDSRFIPTVLPIKKGTKVTFENLDTTLRAIEPLEGKFMPRMQVSPNSIARNTFNTPGAFRVHCVDTPHMIMTVFVTNHSLFTLPRNSGAFAFDDLAPGTYALKIWYHGKWIHQQAVTIPKVRGRGKRNRAKINIEVLLQPSQKKS